MSQPWRVDKALKETETTPQTTTGLYDLPDNHTSLTNDKSSLLPLLTRSLSNNNQQNIATSILFLYFLFQDSIEQRDKDFQIKEERVRNKQDSTKEEGTTKRKEI